MSALPNLTYYNNNVPAFYPLYESTVTVQSVKGINATFSTLNAQTVSISTINIAYANISSISTTSITLDGNTLDTAGSGFGSELLLNGVPIATTANISSIADWAYEPAISTVVMAGNNLIGGGTLFAQNLTAASAASAMTGSFKYINSSNIINSNDITTVTLETSGLLTAASISTPSLKANLISSLTLASATVTVSSITANQISSGTITASIGNFSTLNTGGGATLSTISGNSASFSTLSANQISSGQITAALGTFSTMRGSAILSTLSASTINVNTISSGTIIAEQGIFNYLSTNSISTGSLYVSTLTAVTATFSTLAVSTFVTPPVTLSSLTLQDLTVSNSANFSGGRPNFTTGINTSGPNNFNNTNIDNASNINGSIINVLVGGQTNITANAGDSIFGNPAVNLVSQGGGSSAIRVQAKACSLFAFPIPNSSVDILAEGNVSYIPVAPVPYGGKITLRAQAGAANPLTSPISFLAGNGAIRLTADSYFSFGSLYPPVPGVIALSGGAVLSVAGLTTPATAPYGVGIYSALTCLSLTCGASVALTSFPGTVYLRGDNGTKVLNGLYIDHLYPALGYTLAISGAGGNFVNIQDTEYLGMTNNPAIDGGSMNGQIRNFSSIIGRTVQASTINVSTINTGIVSVDQIYTRNININPPSTIYITHPDLTINANFTTDEGDAAQANNLNLFASSNVNIQSIAGIGGGGGNINIQCANNPALYKISLIGEVAASRTVAAPKVSTLNIELSSINGAAYTPGGGGGGSFVSTATSDLNLNNFNITSVSSITAGGDLSISAITNLKTSAVSTINTVAQTVFTGGVARTLRGANVPQPIIQYGYVSSTGTSGNLTVNIPQIYNAQTSYIPFACMVDSPPAQINVSSISRGSFIIGWSSGGGGNQTFAWQTMGL